MGKGLLASGTVQLQVICLNLILCQLTLMKSQKVGCHIIICEVQALATTQSWTHRRGGAKGECCKESGIQPVEGIGWPSTS